MNECWSAFCLVCNTCIGHNLVRFEIPFNVKKSKAKGAQYSTLVRSTLTNVPYSSNRSKKSELVLSLFTVTKGKIVTENQSIIDQIAFSYLVVSFVDLSNDEFQCKRSRFDLAVGHYISIQKLNHPIFRSSIS